MMPGVKPRTEARARFKVVAAKLKAVVHLVWPDLSICQNSGFALGDLNFILMDYFTKTNLSFCNTTRYILPKTQKSQLLGWHEKIQANYSSIWKKMYHFT